MNLPQQLGPSPAAARQTAVNLAQILSAPSDAANQAMSPAAHRSWMPSANILQILSWDQASSTPHAAALQTMSPIGMNWASSAEAHHAVRLAQMTTVQTAAACPAGWNDQISLDIFHMSGEEFNFPSCSLETRSSFHLYLLAMLLQKVNDHKWSATIFFYEKLFNNMRERSTQNKKNA